jgi:hypothetical protein
LAQNPSFLKRQKELARLRRQQEKQAKRKQRKIEKEEKISSENPQPGDDTPAEG